MEQQSLYSKGAAAFATTNQVKSYVAPADPTQVTGTALGSYASNELLFGPDAAASLFSFPAPRYYPLYITDGVSSTVMFMEHYAKSYQSTVATTPSSNYWYGSVADPNGTYVNPVASGTYPTTKGYGIQFGPTAASALVYLPQGMTVSGMNVALADGSVRVVTSTISTLTWYQGCTANGAETLNSDW